MVKPVLQTDTTAAGGNALQACVASILELELQDVPNFIKADDYLKAIAAFLRPRGMAFLKISLENDPVRALTFPVDEPLCVLTGKSPRGHFRHAVVGRAHGESIQVVHDPHPSGDGIHAPFVWAGFFVSIDPAESSSGGRARARRAKL